MKQLLFLCTGNYYRSRFAEEYVNHHAKLKGLDWVADSMGIQRDFTGNGNVGPIAKNTLNKLAELGINSLGEERMPKHVYPEDIAAADRVVAVSLDEHLPMLKALWSDDILAKIEYFDVEDLHIEGPETALPRLIRHLDTLLTAL